MRGSIEKRGAESWRFRAYLGLDPITREEMWARETVHAATRAEAEEKMTVWLAGLIEDGKYQASASEGRTFLELANRWFNRTEVQPGTMLTERSIIDTALRGLHDRDVKLVNNADVLTDYYKAMRARGAVCRRKAHAGRKLDALRAYLEADATDGGLTDAELAEQIGWTSADIAGWRGRELKGLVARTGLMKPGTRRPVHVFGLTPEGRDWLAEQEVCVAGNCDHGGPLSPEYMQRVHGVVKRIFDYGVDSGFAGLRKNKAKKAKPGKTKWKRPKTPTLDEVRQLIAAAEQLDAEWLCFVFLDAELGARRGEVSAIRLTDFGDNQLTISRSVGRGMDTPDVRREYEGHYWESSVQRGKYKTLMVEKETKTEASERKNKLSPITFALVSEQVTRLVAKAKAEGIEYPATGFLFPAVVDGTRPLHPDTWNARWRKVREQAGLPTVKLHGLRHFVVTQIRKEFGSYAAGSHVGHSRASKTTDAIYGVFLPEAEAEVSNFMAKLLAGPTDPDTNIVPMRRKHQ